MGSRSTNRPPVQRKPRESSPWLGVHDPATSPRLLMSRPRALTPGTGMRVMTPFCQRNAANVPSGSSPYPATWARSLTAAAQLLLPPSVPSSVIVMVGARAAGAAEAGTATTARARAVVDRLAAMRFMASLRRR
jgi:hypothetical protein